jgi:hypothetical protein
MKTTSWSSEIKQSKCYKFCKKAAKIPESKRNRLEQCRARIYSLVEKGVVEPSSSLELELEKEIDILQSCIMEGPPTTRPEDFKKRHIKPRGYSIAKFDEECKLYGDNPTHPNAQFHLGMAHQAYAFQQADPINHVSYTKGIEWIERAAASGHVEAQGVLALLLYKLHGDPDRMVALAKAAADGGDAEGQYVLSHSGRVSPAEREGLLLKAARQKHVEAGQELAEIYSKRGKKQAAIDILQLSADLGEVGPLIQLAAHEVDRDGHTARGYRKQVKKRFPYLSTHQQKEAEALQQRQAVLVFCGGCKRQEPGLAVKEVFKVCARCKLVSYCSKECQRRAWPLHKPGCNRHSSK